MSLSPKILIATIVLVALAGCANSPGIRRGGIEAELAPTHADPVAPMVARSTESEEQPITIKHEDKAHGNAKPEVERGTGAMINEKVASAPVNFAPSTDGQITFNFENEPIQAAVQAILGSLLKENYTIAPAVTGNITFSTSKPITPAQAMPILEMLLAWTNNTLVRKQDRYEILPIKDAIAGNLTPRIASPKIARGYEVRVFPLKYISATEMGKLLKPYAKADAIVSADNARAMMVMAGTGAELENYQRTIDVFDVDWLKGMSVGVYGLRNMEVAKIMPELDKIFGATSDSPLAGMFRFIPMDTTNSIVVITPQSSYLEQAQKWLYRLDMGVGENGTQLYVYDVKNVKAVDLSDHLNAIFTGKSSGRSSTSGNVAPGLRPATIGGGSGGIGGGGLGGTNSQTGLTGQARTPMPQQQNNNVSTTGTGTPNGANGTKETDIRITPIEENNQLLVMATPGEYDSILAAIHRLDVSPLQVQIETKILEVTLDGDLEFGVQWYLAGLIGTSTGSAEGNGSYGPGYTGNSHDRHRASLGAAGGTGPTADGGLFYSFLNKNMEVALSALQKNGNAKALSAPSLVVLNNQEASINVGQQIPIVTTSIVGIGGVSTGTTGTSATNSIANTGIGSSSYISTGVMLNVKPRVNPGGLVYMDVSQEVSVPGTPGSAGANPPINTRQLQTQVAVQSGETVLLGGLIQETVTSTKTGLPLLVDVPVLGNLFGSTSDIRHRVELIVLITPRVIASTEDARTMTDEYRSKFESLAPLRAKEGRPSPPPAPAPPSPPPTALEPEKP